MGDARLVRIVAEVSAGDVDVTMRIVLREVRDDRGAELCGFFILHRRPRQRGTRAHDAHLGEAVEDVVGLDPVDEVRAQRAGKRSLARRLVGIGDAHPDLLLELLAASLRCSFLLRRTLGESGLGVPAPAGRKRLIGNALDLVRVRRLLFVALGLLNGLLGEVRLLRRGGIEGVFRYPHLVSRPRLGRCVPLGEGIARLRHHERQNDGLREIRWQQPTVVEGGVRMQPPLDEDGLPVFRVLELTVRVLQRSDERFHLLAENVLSDVDGAAPDHGTQPRARNDAEGVDPCSFGDEGSLRATGSDRDAVGRDLGLDRRGSEPFDMDRIARMEALGA